MPSDSGVTSSSSISRLPVMRMSACTAAPSATTSSGLSSLCGVLPNSSPTRFHTSGMRSEEHTSELQSRPHLVCRLLLEKKKKTKRSYEGATCVHNNNQVSARLYKDN